MHRALEELILTGGAGNLSVVALVDRAGITRTTFYRHWSSLDEVISQVLTGRFSEPEQVDTGSMLGDLTALQQAEVAMLNDPLFRKVFPYLMQQVADGGEALHTWGAGFVAPRRARVQAVFDRALARGELGEMPNVDRVCDVLLGVLLPAVLLPGSRPLTQQDAEWSARLAAIDAGAQI